VLPKPIGKPIKFMIRAEFPARTSASYSTQINLQERLSIQGGMTKFLACEGQELGEDLSTVTSAGLLANAR
jgi:hypothetical protein